MLLFSLTEISPGSQETTIKACAYVDDRSSLGEAECMRSKIKGSNRHLADTDKHTDSEVK